jgi:hypothetical protein
MKPLIVCILPFVAVALAMSYPAATFIIYGAGAIAVSFYFARVP